MSDGLMKTLADTMNRLIGPGGVYSSNEAAAKAAPGVSRSTFDRIRNGYKPDASAIGIDKLDGVAKAFGLEAWQLLVPNMDQKNPPALKEIADTPDSLSPGEWEIILTFRNMGHAEQEYLLADVKKYSKNKNKNKSNTDTDTQKSA